MDPSKKLIIFSVGNGEIFNQMVKRSVGSSSALENSPLIQESGKESTQPSPGNEQPTSTNPLYLRRIAIDINALSIRSGRYETISSYHPNNRDGVRRAYLQKGHRQPRNHAFPN